MSELILYLQFFLSFILLCLGFLITGNFVLYLLPVRKLESGKYITLLYQLVIGILSAVFIYSIVKTNFTTVNLLLLILIIPLISKNFFKSKFYSLRDFFKGNVKVLKSFLPLVLFSIPLKKSLKE